MQSFFVFYLFIFFFMPTKKTDQTALISEVTFPHVTVHLSCNWKNVTSTQRRLRSAAQCAAESSLRALLIGRDPSLHQMDGIDGSASLGPHIKRYVFSRFVSGMKFLCETDNIFS